MRTRLFILTAFPLILLVFIELLRCHGILWTLRMREIAVCAEPSRGIAECLPTLTLRTFIKHLPAPHISVINPRSSCGKNLQPIFQTLDGFYPGIFPDD